MRQSPKFARHSGRFGVWSQTFVAIPRKNHHALDPYREGLTGFALLRCMSPVVARSWSGDSRLGTSAVEVTSDMPVTESDRPPMRFVGACRRPVKNERNARKAPLFVCRSAPCHWFVNRPRPPLRYPFCWVGAPSCGPLPIAQLRDGAQPADLAIFPHFAPQH
jgi:hypothetical protein